MAKPVTYKKFYPHQRVVWVVVLAGILASLTAAVLIIQRRPPISRSLFSGNSIVAGNRIFPTRIDSALSTGSPYEVVTADFNRDGYTDAATLHTSLSSAGKITILLGDNFGNFTEVPGIPYSVGTFSSELTLANINPAQDNFPDLVVARNIIR